LGALKFAPKNVGFTVGAVAAAVVILLATLFPSPGPGPGGGFLCITCVSAPVANAIRNVLLFVPLGAFGYLAGMRVGSALVAGALLSVSVELAQTVVPGRHPFLLDLITNAAGAGLGAAVAAAGPHWLRPEPRLRRGLFGATAGLAVLLALAPALLLVPSPGPAPLHVEWNPSFGSAGAYAGDVMDVRLGNADLRPGRVDVANLDARFMDGEPLVTTVRAGSPGEFGSGLFDAMSLRDGRSLLTLAVDGHALLVWLPYDADRVGLTRPRIRVHAAFAGINEGVPIEVAVALQRQGRTLTTIRHGAAAERRTEWPAPNPAMGWSLVYVPPGIGDMGADLLAFLWCGGLAFLAAFFARDQLAALAVAIVLITLAATPAVAPLAPLPVSGWAGVAAGWLASRLLRRRLQWPAVAVARHD
jgi:hypothetical protein